ncbi:hypothetical protein [Halotalea alkalilenta]|uniref:hypothetical protein n=1 Tax=Halotalea alkalilenta TaxID=376489 RepID=UPI0012DF5D40|nr:hypothetical protein [Halotalea alkalilenta]
METLYLLIIISNLGKNYRLREDLLAKYLGLKSAGQNKYKSEKGLNYFVLTVSLFYMKNLKRYKSLKEFIEGYILNKMKSTSDVYKKDTESVLLFLDTIVCPYVSQSEKEKLCDAWEIENSKEEIDKIIKLQNYWFTKWTNFDLAEELDRKRSLEVY